MFTHVYHQLPTSILLFSGFEVPIINAWTCGPFLTSSQGGLALAASCITRWAGEMIMSSEYLAA